MGTQSYDAGGGDLAAEYEALGSGAASPCTTCYMTGDHLGSTRALWDEEGLKARYDYLPFGEAVARDRNGRGSLQCAAGVATCYDGPSGVAQRFTGKERDAETGLDYFGARYMSAAQGRFTSPDRPQLDQHAEDPQSWNLYSYVRNNPLRFIDPTGTTLTVSQGWDQAQQDLCRILGGNQCADRISRNEKTGIVTVDLTGIDVSKNAGAKLLGDLTGSANTYDLAYGSTVETQGGQLNVTFIANLDGKPDWRYGKGKQPTDLPRAGVDGQIAFNWSNVTPTSTNSLLPAERYSVVFHELAEAFAKVDHGMPYMAKGVPRQGAHYDSMDREKILRRERPELLKHNIGAGPGTNYNVIQKTRRRP